VNAAKNNLPPFHRGICPRTRKFFSCVTGVPGNSTGTEEGEEEKHAVTVPTMVSRGPI
jgi:hypothetical protein